MEDQLENFAYIKFYFDDGKEYAIVAGKSGSLRVNKSSGCDLSFSTDLKHGKVRKWLQENKKECCQTEILIVYSDDKGLEKNLEENRKKAYEIEGKLKKAFELLGS